MNQVQWLLNDDFYLCLNQEIITLIEYLNLLNEEESICQDGFMNMVKQEINAELVESI